MWVPAQVIDWFTALRHDADSNAEVVKEALAGLREDLAAVRAERDALKQQLTSVQINADWLRIRVNTLEMERAGLIERAYNIKLPIPELVRAKTIDPTIEQFSFDDMGDELARKYGLPVYDEK